MSDTQRLEEPYHPSEEESILILPLIDEYEKSKEKIVLLAALRQIWRAHRPDIEIDDISEIKLSEDEGLSEEPRLSEGEGLSDKGISRPSSP